MRHIQELSSEVANTIAAGEVVERPVSIVKELVENAIDAGATTILVTIQDGGKKLIKVSDNGKGIGKEDLSVVAKRHHTSKINQVEDLLNIHTHGFRGEALASIAAVSDFEIRSHKKGEDHGWQVVFKGIEREIKPIGIPEGTEIIVKNLFKTVPARKNFLKADSTEAAHILEYLHEIALVFPKISIKFEKDGRTTFQTNAQQKTEETLTSIVGKELAKKLIPIYAQHPQVEVTGFIGEPGVGTPSKPKQFVFVNNRPVEESIIRSAVYKGYGSVLGRLEKPQFVVMVKISPHLVDFNVHPQKKEVRFIDSQIVFELVKQAVANALGRYSFNADKVSAQETSLPVWDMDSGQVSGLNRAQTPTYNEKGSSREYVSSTPKLPTNRSVKQVFSSFLFAESAQTHIAFQVLKCFLIEELPDGLMVYDQHAVHERILYEKFTRMFLDQTTAGKQSLLVPTEIELSPTEVSSLQESQFVLEKLGFLFEIHPASVMVKQVPAVLGEVSLTNLIKEYLEDLQRNEKLTSTVNEIDNQTHQRIAYLSCRSAVKAGDELSPSEIKRLLDDYHQTTNAFTCPHGRPVQVKFTTAEIEKWFKRS